MQMFSPEEVVDRYVAAINAHDADTAAQVMSEDCEFRARGFDRRGRAAARQFWSETLKMYPDGQLAVTGQVTAGSTVVIEAQFTGTNSGPVLAVNGEQISPPTGRQVTLRAAAIADVQGEEIASLHLYYDTFAQAYQLGVLQALADRATKQAQATQ
jgi:hypothetical protein